MDRISHPRLSQVRLDAIAERHTSDAAVDLLREIVRLRAVESYALQLAGDVKSSNWNNARDTTKWLLAAQEGRLPKGARFAVDELPM